MSTRFHNLWHTFDNLGNSELGVQTLPVLPPSPPPLTVFLNRHTASGRVASQCWPDVVESSAHQGVLPEPPKDQPIVLPELTEDLSQSSIESVMVPELDLRSCEKITFESRDAPGVSYVKDGMTDWTPVTSRRQINQ